MLVKELLFGYYHTQCLYAVVQYNIAEHLQAGPKSIVELAKLCGAEKKKLYRVMRFLAHKGLFDHHLDDYFGLNEHSQYLRLACSENHINFIRLHAKYFYPAAMGLADSLTTNVPAFELEFGHNAGDYFRNNYAAGKIYNSAMRENSELLGRLIAEIYDFSACNNIYDIGGGGGSLLANILLKNKNCNGLNMDLPSVQQLCEEYFDKIGVTARAKFIAGDFNQHIPTGGDLYIIKSILHARDDAACVSILKSIKNILPEHGKLLVIERIIAVELERNSAALVSDINMLNVSSGRVRTYEEFTTLFAQAGYNVNNTYPVIDAITIFELS